MRRSTVIFLGALGVLTLLALAWGLASASDVLSTRSAPDTSVITPTAATPTPSPTATPVSTPPPVPPSPTPTARPQPTTAPARPSPPPASTSPSPGTQRLLAPIEDATIAVLESFPPQYVVHVRAGLPSGCTRPDGYEVTRSGQSVRVQVFNARPAGNPICTQVYGTYEVNIPLGSNFEPGRTYAIEVNNKRLTLEAR